MLQQQFQSRLREALRARGWSQSALAREMHISPQAVGDYIHGRCCPGLNVVEKFADALGVDANDLLDKKPLEILQVST